MQYIYPSLSERDLGFVRIGGAGLANCLFVACRAYSFKKQFNAQLIRPSWEKLSIGPIIRREKDKRHYIGLFNKSDIRGLKKIKLIHSKSYAESSLGLFCKDPNGILKVSGLGQYFQNLSQSDAVEYLFSRINDSVIESIRDYDFSKTIAVHIRMGDYSAEWRTPLSWYHQLIETIHSLNPNIQFALFSDGTDQELSSLISLPNTSRVFFGNALSDIIAISRSKLVLASDSTFSAWGAFLGGVPVIFPKRHFPPVYRVNEGIEYILDGKSEIPMSIKSIIESL